VNAKLDKALEVLQLCLKLLPPGCREELRRLLTFISLAADPQAIRLDKEVRRSNQSVLYGLNLACSWCLLFIFNLVVQYSGARVDGKLSGSEAVLLQGRGAQQDAVQGARGTYDGLHAQQQTGNLQGQQNVNLGSSALTML